MPEQHTRKAEINFADVPVDAIRRLVTAADTNRQIPVTIFDDDNIQEGLYESIQHSRTGSFIHHVYQASLLMKICNDIRIPTKTKTRGDSKVKELQQRILSHLDNQSRDLEIWRK